MQPDMISLMQQLVTAVQSMALSVDVISMDIRALNKNVAQLVKREINSSMSPLTLAPECTYSHEDETSPQLTPAPVTEQTTEGEAASPAVHEEGMDQTQKSPSVRDALREDIKKAMEKPGDPNVGPWTPKDAAEALADDAGDKHPWMGHGVDFPLFPLSSDVCSGVLGETSGWEGQMATPKQEGDTPTTPRHSQRFVGIPQSHIRGMAGADGRQEDKPKVNYRFTCEECGKGFPDKFKYERHIRVHTGEKPFSCSQCGKAFAEKDKLLSHKRTHSGERPYSCEICGRAFIQKDKLKSHRRVHSGERPFQCRLCGKDFKYSSNLKKHSSLHEKEMYSNV